VVKEDFRRVIVQEDNATVIQALKGSISVPWYIKIITRDISKYLSLMEHFKILHIYREVNMAAD